MDPIFVYRNPDVGVGEIGAGAIDPGDAAAGRSAAEGGLQGLRVSVQPNISVEGWPTDAGSRALAGFIALEDATVVDRLRQAAACLCGSTAVSELGLGLANSRAGEALRQQEVDAELMLDLMGESRLAAARAGVCGFKPSYGLVSRFGLVDLIPSMECCAILSRSPRTIRDILEAIAGQDGLDFSLPAQDMPDFSPQSGGPMTIDPGGTSIGVVTEALSTLSAEHALEFDTALSELKEAGLTVREVSLPEFPLFSPVHQIVGSVEASSCAGRYDSVRYGPRAPGAKNWNEMYLLSRGAAFGTSLKSYLMQGAFLQFERYAAFEDACRIRGRLVADMQRLMTQIDFLALPLFGEAPSGSPMSPADLYADFASALFANVTGQPALYLPPRPGAIPMGLQLAGPRLSDARLLALGELLFKNRGGE